MKQVSTSLPAHLVRELDHLAAQQQVSRAELIRALILEALDGRELDQGMRA
jgi:metal-responsive CopG/Arc/MetJ family transcriptional regulator